LEEMGFKKILMVPEGLKVSPLSELKKKESIPKIIFIGRLKKAKLPHHALEAFSIIKREFEDAQMSFIGDGYMRKKLEKPKIKDVTFYGHVNEELKYQLLSRAHLILVPGIREGWGLVVTEANAMGTPAVGYNVPGLRDSIKNDETGILVKNNSPNELASSAISLLQKPEKLHELSTNALAFARKFSWDTTAMEFEKIIKGMK
jgi:glycosyltransferase involved in cell wall biosynthesis